MNAFISKEGQVSYVVVAGADDGADGRRVIEAAASHIANRLGGELHVLHLSPASELHSELTLVLLEHAQVSLAHVAKTLHEPLRCRASVHIRDGVPWHEIVHEARARSAELIVIGTHGRSGAARLLLGSQGEEVLRHAPCAVLVVRDVYPAGTSECAPDEGCPDCAREGAGGDWCTKHAGHGVKSHRESAPRPGGDAWEVRS